MTAIQPNTDGKKIRVLFVSHSPHFYGAEQSLLCLLRGIDRSKFVPIVTLPDRVPEHKERLYKEISALGIPIHVIQSSLWINVADDTSLTKALLDELTAVDQLLTLLANEKIDIVYTNTITRISGAIAAARAGLPHLYHVREVLKDHPLRSLIDIDATFKLLARFSDAVITNSCAVATQFAPEDVQDKLRVVYNAADAVFFDAPSNPGILRRELGVTMDEKLIGIIGTIHPHKNHEDLIHAFALMKERNTTARIIIAGNSLCDYQKRLEEIIEQSGLNDRVHFLGFRNDIVDIVHDLDVVVIASLGEPFGRTTIEAMAAGKPVVAADTGASPEIVVDGVTGRLVPLHGHQQMADALSQIISDADLGQSMGRAGRERAQAVFSVEKYITSIQETLVKLAATSGKKGAAPHEIAATVLELVPEVDLLRFARTLLANWEQCSGEMTLLYPARDIHLQRLRHLLDEYKLLYRQKYVEAEGVYIRLDREQRQNEVMRQQLQDSQQRCADLENSLSWRITAPLRSIVDLFQKK